MRRLNQRTKPWISGSALVAFAVFLFLQTFILPNVPRSANGDQGIHLSLAAQQAASEEPRDRLLFGFFFAVCTLAPVGVLVLFWRMFHEDRGVHPIYRK